MSRNHVIINYLLQLEAARAVYLGYEAEDPKPQLKGRKRRLGLVAAQQPSKRRLDDGTAKLLRHIHYLVDIHNDKCPIDLPPLLYEFAENHLAALISFYKVVGPTDPQPLFEFAALSNALNYLYCSNLNVAKVPLDCWDYLFANFCTQRDLCNLRLTCRAWCSRASRHISLVYFSAHSYRHNPELSKEECFSRMYHHFTRNLYTIYPGLREIRIRLNDFVFMRMPNYEDLIGELLHACTAPGVHLEIGFYDNDHVRRIPIEIDLKGGSLAIYCAPYTSWVPVRVCGYRFFNGRSYNLPNQICNFTCSSEVRPLTFTTYSEFTLHLGYQLATTRNLVVQKLGALFHELDDVQLGGWKVMVENLYIRRRCIKHPLQQPLLYPFLRTLARNGVQLWSNKPNDSVPFKVCSVAEFLLNCKC